MCLNVVHLPSCKNECIILHDEQSPKALWPGIASNSSMCSMVFLLLPLRLLWSLYALVFFHFLYFILYFIIYRIAVVAALRHFLTDSIALYTSFWTRTLPSKHACTSDLPQMARSITHSPGVQFDPRTLSLLLKDI